MINAVRATMVVPLVELVASAAITSGVRGACGPLADRVWVERAKNIAERVSAFVIAFP